MSLHKSLLIAYLSLICCIVTPRLATGFQQQPRRRGRSTFPSIKTREPLSFLHVSNIDDPTPTPPEEKETTSSSDSQLDWKMIKDINNKFWEYTCNFFYITISLGILLNFSGYSYTVSAKNGLNIRPISEVRQEMQWDQEMKRYDYEAQQKSAILNEKQMLESIQRNDVSLD